MSVKWEVDFIYLPLITMTFISFMENLMKKVAIIERYEAGKLTLKECYEICECSERTWFRWLKKYREDGAFWLVHGLIGKPSNHQWEETKYWDIKKIVTQAVYAGFWPTLMREHLEEDFIMVINKETLRQIMIKAWVWTPNPRKKEIIRNMRERKAKLGMMTQFDGSYHDWFEDGEEQCLLHAIDDATWRIFCRFGKWESLEEVFNFFVEYFKRFGKPESIYVDCHSTYKVNHPEDWWDKPKQTCFSRWMERLWIVVIYSKCPEGKGRVERGNGTHQDRLVKKMRLKGIKTPDEGNKFLDSYYLDHHNTKFGKTAKEPWDNHQPLTEFEEKELEWFFAKESKRTVKRDGTISYNNTIYQLPKWTVLKSREITVKESIHGNVRLCDWMDCLQFTNLRKR